MTLMLALARGLIPQRETVIDGSWTRDGLFCAFPSPVRDLAGARLGLIGRSQIATAVAERARAFGMDVVTAERRGAPPRAGRLAFDEVLETADVLSLHCPPTDETHHLIGADTLARVKPGLILINTARGALVDVAALAAALDDGRIAGAGLDVAPMEPPADGDPILALARRRNVIVTPHTAWTSSGALDILAEALIQNVEGAL